MQWLPNSKLLLYIMLQAKRPTVTVFEFQVATLDYASHDKLPI